MNQTLGKHYHAIDLGRGVAAFSILIWHYQHFVVTGYTNVNRAKFPFYKYLWPFYEEGGLAVQFFWIVSGFIFPAVYFCSETTFKSFFVHRVARLYPLHILTLFAVIVLQFFCRAKFGHDLIYPTGKIDDLLVQIFLASGWFQSTAFSFNGPVWSVSAEILVYVLFWSLLPALYRFGVLGPLLLAGLSFTFRSWQPANCAGYFFLGVCLYELNRNATLRVQLAMLTLFITVGAVSFWVKINGIGFLAAFLAVVLALALLDRQGVGSLAQRVPWIADNCYGSYLWHIPIQLFLLLVIGGVGAAVVLQPWFFLSYLTIVTLVARVSFLLFEGPARRWVRRRLLGH